MSNEWEQLIGEIEAENAVRDREKEQLREELTVDETAAEKARLERMEKVAGFRLDLQLDEEPSEEESEPVKEEAFTDETVPLAPETVEPTDKKEKKKAKKKKSGCLGSALYVLIIVLVSIVLAVVLLVAVMDVSGLGKSDKTVTVSIPKGSNTQSIADILAEKELIDHPLLFRLYSRFTGADGTYQPHDELDLSPDMGYSAIIAAIQESKPRESVSVTIPEGSTVQEIAKLLEKNKACSASDFIDAILNGDYSDYEFLKGIPTAEQDERYANRLYLLEGYLFPDTYSFYVNGSAETVVRKMLNNFEKRVGTSLLTSFEARGLTLDEAVVMASIIQAEVSDPNDMARVSRVLYNRLADGSEYPRLQCDTTQLYLKALVGSYDDSSALAKAYDTYQFEGLPIGAIGNPGLDALEAVARPSSETKVKDCYFFVADVRTGETFYSKTWKQHLKKCKELGLA